ncbi:MAG TPA: SMC-Scp complex subunit ScpB [Actinokineospora sp.]|nr:SMC-Scp complex subunit ScpB [Actinokineospora sp.]
MDGAAEPAETVETPETPDVPEAAGTPEAPEVEADAALELPDADEVSEADAAPEEPEASETDEIPEVAEGRETPESLVTGEVSEGDGAEGEEGGDAPGSADLIATGSFPDLTEDDDLDSALEALLLVVDAPAEDELLATAVDQSVARVRLALRRMAGRYAEQGSGIDLRRVGDGWRFYTRDKYAPVVEKFLLDGQRAKLTRAALETLAVIAYRQPVTRSRVAAVRGVNVDGVIRTLVVRGLIQETGTDAETGGILYRTTELFLERLGLSSLEDLPPIAPLLPEVDAIDDVE